MHNNNLLKLGLSSELHAAKFVAKKICFRNNLSDTGTVRKLDNILYVFCGDSITPDPEKTEDIINPQTQTLASDVGSLLGKTSYCSRFIPDYATETDPLGRLTHKDQPWEWTQQHDSSVNELKDTLVKAPITAYFG